MMGVSGVVRTGVMGFLIAGLGACGSPGGQAGPTEVVKAFKPGTEQPITASGVAAADGGWEITAANAGSVRLFEVPGETCESCRLVYRAKLRTIDLAAPAYLEMWVRAPGKGEFFSKGVDQTVRGTTDWATYEIPFFLQKGERGDLIKLNVAFEGPGGRLGIKDVELLRSPLG
jgi:hypothetical protein